MSSVMGTVTDADVYKAALDHARQLSTLRFAILTVFMTASGALFGAYFAKDSTFPAIPIIFAGFWLAVVFLACEIALSFTMARQNKVAQEKALGLHPNAFRHRHWFALWAIRILVPSIHIIVAGYWSYLYIHLLCLSR